MFDVKDLIDLKCTPWLICGVSSMTMDWQDNETYQRAIENFTWTVSVWAGIKGKIE